LPSVNDRGAFSPGRSRTPHCRRGVKRPLDLSRRLFLVRYGAAVSVTAVVAGLGWGVAHADAQRQPGASRLALETRRGRFVFMVEVADTPAARAEGLMGRRHLADDAGMLFDFGAPQEVSMWMKNTFIPLDMIFIDDRGRVTGFAVRTVPHSLTSIRSGLPARAVLEVVAGTVEKIGLRPGDRVTHPIFATIDR
jgi:uncharacterized membrane protein (UPF0127 family)